MSDVIYDIANEVAEERLRQVEKWGQQDHPSVNPGLHARYSRASEHWHNVNDARVVADAITWEGILLEEVYEALSEPDPLLRREELVQVAAVAAAEVEAIDRLLDSPESPYLDGFETEGDEISEV